MSGLMLPTAVLERLRSLAQEISVREGCELYDLEFTGGARGRVLRIFIDRAGSGASLDDCANVSRGMNLLLDVENLIPGGGYELEVSTPGIERKLTQPWHFSRASGQQVRVHLAEAIASAAGGPPQKNLHGRLVSANDLQVVIEQGESRWEVPLKNIVRAQVVFQPPKPEKGQKKR